VRVLYLLESTIKTKIFHKILIYISRYGPNKQSEETRNTRFFEIPPAFLLNSTSPPGFRKIEDKKILFQKRTFFKTIKKYFTFQICFWLNIKRVENIVPCDLIIQ